MRSTFDPGVPAGKSGLFRLQLRNHFLNKRILVIFLSVWPGTQYQKLAGCKKYPEDSFCRGNIGFDPESHCISGGSEHGRDGIKCRNRDSPRLLFRQIVVPGRLQEFGESLKKTRLATVFEPHSAELAAIALRIS